MSQKFQKKNLKNTKSSRKINKHNNIYFKKTILNYLESFGTAMIYMECPSKECPSPYKSFRDIETQEIILDAHRRLKW